MGIGGNRWKHWEDRWKFEEIGGNGYIRNGLGFPGVGGKCGKQVEMGGNWRETGGKLEGNRWKTGGKQVENRWELEEIGGNRRKIGGNWRK